MGLEEMKTESDKNLERLYEKVEQLRRTLHYLERGAFFKFSEEQEAIYMVCSNMKGKKFYIDFVTGIIYKVENPNIIVFPVEWGEIIRSSKEDKYPRLVMVGTTDPIDYI